MSRLVADVTTAGITVSVIVLILLARAIYLQW